MPAKITLNISACAHNIQDNLSCLTENFSRVLISRFSDMQNESIFFAIFPGEPQIMSPQRAQEKLWYFYEFNKSNLKTTNNNLRTTLAPTESTF